MEIEEPGLNDKTERNTCSSECHGWNKAHILILCFVALERLAFQRCVLELSYVDTGNTYLNYSSITLGVVDNVFEGFAYFFPIFGGLLGDMLCPRKYIILVSLLVFIAGSILIPCAVAVWRTEHLVAQNLSVAALCLLVVAEGGIRANIVVLGVQQGPPRSKRNSSFFHWYYFALSIGSLCALFLESFRTYGWAGYLVIPAAIVVATIVFLSGWKLYRNEEAEEDESSYTNSAKWTTLSRSFSAIMRHSRGSADIQQEQQEIRPILTQQREIQHKNVNRFKRILKVIMIQGTLIFYWSNYFQIFGAYDVQAAELLLHHDILINDELLSLHLWMQTYNIGAVLTMIPLCFYVIYPLIERKRGKPNRLLVKIGAGLAIACLSSLVAVMVELGRCSRPKPVKTLTIHVQAPIFLLLGLSQVFVAIAGLEFAYGLVPRALPGLAVGIWYAAMGIGSFAMQILYQISRYVFEKEGRATSCYPEDQRTEIFFHLDYYFITFFVISLVNFAFFVLISLKATRIGGYNDTPEGCLDDQFSHSYELQARRRGSNTAQYS